MTRENLLDLKVLKRTKRRAAQRKPNAKIREKEPH
jgi:hypothetical protein